MSFGGLLDDGGAEAPGMQFAYQGPGSGVFAFASSPAISLAMADAADRDRVGVGVVPAVHGGGGGGGGKGRNARKASRAEKESRSGSGRLDVVSGGEDEDVELGNPRKRGKRYHRHTPQQIKALEALFKEFPHPSERQRAELSRKLGLETRQVKFWFQNRRTQMKTQTERHENALLKRENDQLLAENLTIREAMRHPFCVGCCGDGGGGGPAMIGVLSQLEEQHLRVENARLRDELIRVCALAAKFIGKPLPLLGPSMDLAVGGIGSVPSTAMPISTTPESTAASCPTDTVTTPMRAAPLPMAGIDRSLFLELAVTAMEELVKMAQMGEPLWVPGAGLPGSPSMEALNNEEYSNLFSPCIGVKPAGFVSEASRESGIVITDSSAALVEILMDETRWSDMFSCLIAKSSTIGEMSTGVAGSRDDALLLMQAELQVLSPLVPVREVTFLRFCKQLCEGVWAVVDVSIDDLVKDQGLGRVSAIAGMNCRRLPSGCVLQDTSSGFCKVTWVEHTEYDQEPVHPLYRSLLQSGLTLGAGRWLATLQRQCECLAILMSYVASPQHDSAAAVLPAGIRSLLKLAQRMEDSFCAGVSLSSAREWSKPEGLMGSIGEDVHVMARKSVDEPGVPPGVVLSAATSVWMPVTPEELFSFLRSEVTRAEWDVLSNGGPVQEVASIAKGQQDGNTVSLLRANATNATQNSMLILQETSTDASGSMIVYAPVDIPAMHLVMGGGDPTCVALLPSGFSILPAGPSVDGAGETRTHGSLLTIAFQILVDSHPGAKLTAESVRTVNSLVACTINRIKTSLQCDG